VTPFLRYTLLRLLVIAAAAVPLHLAGLRGALLLAAAVLLGAVLAYLVLAGPRRAMVEDAAAGEARRGTPVRDADADAEDAADDAARQERLP
jgi:hypothetical protein